MVLLKNERGKREKIVCILAKLVEDMREKKKIITLFYLNFFNLSKIYPTLLWHTYRKKLSGIRYLTYYLKKKSIYLYI